MIRFLGSISRFRRISAPAFSLYRIGSAGLSFLRGLDRGCCMILELTLDNFKSFFGFDDSLSLRGATIRFGGFSVIIGTNASGKSNIRDGLRFIHGVGRGYTLAEVFGGKYGEGGELQWTGIRGGLRETVTRNGSSAEDKFTIKVRTRFEDDAGVGTADYTITVDVGDRSWPPTVFHESLALSRRSTVSFEVGQPDSIAPGVVEVCVRGATDKTPKLMLG